VPASETGPANGRQSLKIKTDGNAQFSKC